MTDGESHEGGGAQPKQSRLRQLAEKQGQQTEVGRAMRVVREHKLNEELRRRKPGR